MIIAWLCFRDLRLTSLVLASGVYSAAAALAVVPLFGVPLNAILITMVPLVYVTGISGAIHLSNYYLEAARHGTLPEAPGKAVAHAAVPLVLAAVTTALGLALAVLQRTETHPAVRRVFGDWRGDRFADPVHVAARGAGGVDAAASAMSPHAQERWMRAARPS